MKAEIPKELYMAVVRVQAAENLDWNEACVRASQLIDVDKDNKRISKDIGMSVHTVYTVTSDLRAHGYRHWCKSKI